MENESTLYYVGFDEAIGCESESGNMYKNVCIYSRKDNSEIMVLPFYFILGKHDYMWNAEGDRILLSACSGFYEIGADILPDEYARWTSLIVVADVAKRCIEKVYEGESVLCWNSAETDILSNDGLVEYSYTVWAEKYEERKAELEKIIDKKESDYYKAMLGFRSPNRSSLLGDIIDESIGKETIGNNEAVEGSEQTKRKSKLIVYIVLALVVLVLVLIRMLKYEVWF